MKDTDRHGNDRYYFRAPGRKKVWLREPPAATSSSRNCAARAKVTYVRPGTLPEICRRLPKPSEPAKKGTLLWPRQEYYRRGGTEITEDTMARPRAILERVCELPHPLGLGNKMRQWCDQAELPHCRAHGIRKAGATIAAENGATAALATFRRRDARAAEGDIWVDDVPAARPLPKHLLVIDRKENKIVPLSRRGGFRWDNYGEKIVIQQWLSGGTGGPE